MSPSNALKNQIVKVVAIGCLSLTVIPTSYALDVDQVDQLQKEIQEIKLRLTKLESSQGNSNTNQKPVMSSEGWKTLSNWRHLKTSLTPDDVRTILGEPSRINGGELAHWFYPNGGRVTFMTEKLWQWTEPGKN